MQQNIFSIQIFHSNLQKSKISSWKAGVNHKEYEWELWASMQKYGMNWANSVVCDGKMNNNLRFLCIQRKTETIWKYRILFVEVYEAGSDRSVKTVGNPAEACIAKWCISCKNNASPTSGRVGGAFRVCGWAVCQRTESFQGTWRFLIYKEGRQSCLTGLHSSGNRRRISRETAGNPGCTAWLRPCNLLLRKCRRKVVAFFRSIR